MMRERLIDSRMWVPGDDLWRRLAENVEEIAIILLDPSGRVASWNRGAERLKGYTAEEILGRSFEQFYPQEAVLSGHPGRELAAAASIGRYAEEGWRVRKDGSRFWAQVALTAIYDDQGEIEAFGKLTCDLTAAKQAVDQRAQVIALLESTAATDFLTGLPNRRSWDEILARELSRAARDGSTCCIAVLDIDHFKEINDQLGHLEGDHFLKRCAGVWRGTVRASDVLARFGGEEFVLLLPQCGLEEAKTVTDRVRLATPDGRTCSAGLAAWDQSESMGGLFARADHALYDAKAAGRNLTKIAAASYDTPRLVEQRA